MDGIDNFVPSCVVCRNPLLRERTTHNRETCSAECTDIWRQYCADLAASRHCPSCWHPSTPEERAEFREWRKARGDLHSRGRPPSSVGLKLRRTVEAAGEFLTGSDVDRLVSLAKQLQELLDQNQKP